MKKEQGIDEYISTRCVSKYVLKNADKYLSAKKSFDMPIYLSKRIQYKNFKE